jgi:uncharacterized protein
VKYQANDAILHCDTDFMPKRRKCWSSWVYTERGPQDRARISLSYWMNSLQPIPQDDLMFVTLNANHPVREECIYDTYTFDHPVYDMAACRRRPISALSTAQTGHGFAGLGCAAGSMRTALPVP